MPSITLCGETYSPNLGDGVIALALNYVLSQSLAECTIDFLDLSGRAGYEETLSARPSGAAMSLAMHRNLMAKSDLYGYISTSMKWWIASRRHYRAVLEETMAETDLLIIGGGNLLMDNHLNFPLKIYFAVQAAEAQGVRVVFLSCGVGEYWSWIGRKLIGKSLRRKTVGHISVRDDQSMTNLCREFPKVQTPTDKIVDPGVFISDLYGVSPATTGRSAPIGLGVMHPFELKKRSDGHDFRMKMEQEFWTRLARSLIEEGYRVRIFTNGAMSDHSFAETVASEVPSDVRARNDVGQLLCRRPRHPRELVAQIRRFGGVVAYRLHANVVAYSLGVPGVGLIWDRKVKAWFKEADRERFALRPHVKPREVVEALSWALQEGIDEQYKSSMKENVRRSVTRVMRDNLPSGG